MTSYRCARFLLVALAGTLALIRYSHVGEGDYTGSESMLGQLLAE